MAQFGFESAVSLPAEPVISPGKNLKAEPFGTSLNISSTGTGPSKPAFREPMFEIFKPGYWVCYGCNKIFMETESIGRHLYTCLDLKSYPVPKNPRSASFKSEESFVVTATPEKITSVLPVLDSPHPRPPTVKPQQGEAGLVTCHNCSRSYNFKYIEDHKRRCLKTNCKGAKRGRKSKLSKIVEPASTGQGDSVVGLTKGGGSDTNNIFVKAAAAAGFVPSCSTTSVKSSDFELHTPKSELPSKNKLNSTFMYCKHCSDYIHHEYFQHHIQNCVKYHPSVPDQNL